MSEPERIANRQLDMHATYMQFSKKIAIAAIVSWVIAFISAAAFVIFAEINPISADLIKTIVGYSATLTGTVVVAYMGNSGLEKYARYKYDFENARREIGAPYTPPQTILTNRSPSNG